MAIKIVWMTKYNSCFATIISKPGKNWRTNQNHISFPEEAQNKRINLTNPVLVSRWIAPNKVRGEYQWGFKITKCLQNSILHHSKQEQRKYVSNWKVYNNRVATTSIFNVQAPFFGTRALYFPEQGPAVYSLYTFEQQKTTRLSAIPAKLS